MTEKLDTIYLNGTYHTLLQALDYVLPSLVQNFGADAETSSKVYCIVAHNSGLILRAAEGDPLEVLKYFPKIEEPLIEALHREKAELTTDELEKCSEELMDIIAVTYTYLQNVARESKMEEVQRDNCSRAWQFISCLAFSLVSVVFGQEKASRMSHEVLKHLIDKRLVRPEHYREIFNSASLPQSYFDNAMVHNPAKGTHDDNSPPDYLTKFGSSN
jgi:hypothetical protein